MIHAVGAAALALALSAATPAPAPSAAQPAQPPSAAEASQLRSRKAWDELYLRYSAVKPADYQDADRKVIAAMLLEASKALGDDLALAVACAEKSAELAPTLEAWLGAGDAYLKLKQVAAAATAYEKAVLLAPTSSRALISRADLAMQEGEPELAASLYEKVSPKAAEAKSAREKLAKAQAAAQEKAKAMAELTQADRKVVLAAKNGKPPEDPNALSNETTCAESMHAVCALARRCMPGDPGAKACDDTVTDECAKVEGVAKVTRKEMDACVAGLARASCDKFLGGARRLTELSASCQTVEAAIDRLRDSPGPGH